MPTIAGTSTTINSASSGSFVGVTAVPRSLAVDQGCRANRRDEYVLVETRGLEPLTRNRQWRSTRVRRIRSLASMDASRCLSMTPLVPVPSCAGSVPDDLALDTTEHRVGTAASRHGLQAVPPFCSDQREHCPMILAAEHGSGHGSSPQLTSDVLVVPPEPWSCAHLGVPARPLSHIGIVRDHGRWTSVAVGAALCGYHDPRSQSTATGERRLDTLLRGGHVNWIRSTVARRCCSPMPGASRSATNGGPRCGPRGGPSAGWPAAGTFHAPRHFFATTLITNGVEPQDVQNAMRHASLRITLETYVHWWPRKESAAASSAMHSARPPTSSAIAEQRAPDTSSAR